MLQTMINHKSCNHANVGQHIGFDNSKLGSRGKLSGLGLERHMEDKDSTQKFVIQSIVDMGRIVFSRGDHGVVACWMVSLVKREMLFQCDC